MQERECPFMSKIVNEVGVTTEVISCSKQKSTNFCHPESKEVAEDKCMDQHERVAIVLAVSNQRISHIFRRQGLNIRSEQKYNMRNKVEKLKDEIMEKPNLQDPPCPPDQTR